MDRRDLLSDSDTVTSDHRPTVRRREEVQKLL